MNPTMKFAGVLLAAVALVGCSTEGKIGGLAGAGAGAGLGYLAGGAGGALIGAAAGGLIGTGIGEAVHHDQHHAPCHVHGCRAVRYCPSGGEQYPAEYQVCPVHRSELAWAYYH
jgi:hypothetical protein